MGRKKKIRGFLTDFFILLLACCVSAFSVVGVMIPNGLTSGGLTGIVRIIQRFVDIDFSLLFYGGAFIIFILVTIFLGWKESKKILLLTVMYPAVLMAFEQIDFQLLETKDILLAAVFCGIFSGINVGLIFWRGYASAGTDAIAKIFKKKLFPQMGLSHILLVIDAVIIISSAFVYGRNIALYALITQIIVTKTSEIIMFGLEGKVVQLSIITCEGDAIKDFVMGDLERGVTSFEIRGEYTQHDMRQLLVICSPRESILIKKKLAELDPHAFVTVTRVETVWGAGRGFHDIEKD